MSLELIKHDAGGKTYQGDGFKLLYRNKGSVSGDNNINKKEHLYLLDGQVKLTIQNTAKLYSAPAEFTIPEKTYHKIDAITDSIIIIF